MYDPKINRSKGLEAGTLAACASALTSVLYVVIDHHLPNLTDNEVNKVATGLGILICSIAAAVWKMNVNRRKHT